MLMVLNHTQPLLTHCGCKYMPIAHRHTTMMTIMMACRIHSFSIARNSCTLIDEHTRLNSTHFNVTLLVIKLNLWIYKCDVHTSSNATHKCKCKCNQFKRQMQFQFIKRAHRSFLCQIIFLVRSLAFSLLSHFLHSLYLARIISIIAHTQFHNGFLNSIENLKCHPNHLCGIQMIFNFQFSFRLTFPKNLGHFSIFISNSIQISCTVKHFRLIYGEIDLSRKFIALFLSR